MRTKLGVGFIALGCICAILGLAAAYALEPRPHLPVRLAPQLLGLALVLTGVAWIRSSKRARYIVGMLLTVLGAVIFALAILLLNSESDLKSGAGAAIDFFASGVALMVCGLGIVRNAPKDAVGPWAEHIQRRYSQECSAETKYLRGGSDRVPSIPVSLEPYPLAFARHIRRDYPSDPNGLADRLLEPLPVEIVIVGARGCGKTVILREVQRAILNHPRGSAIIPLFVRLADWRRGQTPEQWITEAVHLDSGLPRDTVMELIRRDRVVLLLDALDEIERTEYQVDRATEALAALHTLGCPMLVSCRTELADALSQRRAFSDEILAVEVPELPIEVVAALAKSASSDVLIGNALQEVILDNREGALANRLRTTLFLRTLMGSKVDQHELLALSRLAPTPPWGADLIAVEELLFGTWLRQVVTGRSRETDDESRPSHWRHADVSRWCSTLARYVQSFGGTEVSGDILPRTLILQPYMWVLSGQRSVRAAAIAITTTLWLPFVAGCIFLIRTGQVSPSLSVALIAATFLGYLSSLAMLGKDRALRINPEHLFTASGLRQMGIPRLLIGSIAATGVSTVAALAYWPDYGAAVPLGVGFLISFGLGMATAVRPDIDLAALGWSGFVLGSLISTTLLHYLGTSVATIAFADGAGAGAVALVVGRRVGTYFWRRTGRTNLAFRPMPYADPYFRLKSDLQTAAVIGLIAALLTFTVLRYTPLFDIGSVTEVLLAAAAGTAAGPGLMSVAWRRHLAMLLLARDRLPFYLKPFLEWAYKSGILRRSAAAYEFRHEQLQAYFVRETV